MPAPHPAGADRITVEKRGGVAAAPAAGAGQMLDADRIRFRISNEDEDAFGDVVVQDGLEFPAAIPAIADHSPSLAAAVGDWHNVERAGRETFATLRLLPAGVSRMADLVRALHRGGFPIASSIHFDIHRDDIEPIVKAGPNGRATRTGSRYRKGKVKEITITQFPANASAVAVARSMGFNDAELAALSRPEPAQVSIARSTQAVAAATGRTTTMTLAELIAAAQAAHDTAQGSLGTATLAYEADQSEANLTAVQRATAEVDALFGRLNVLRSAETAATRRAAAAAAPAGAAPTAVSRAVATVAGAPAAPAVNTRRTETKDVKAGTRMAQMVIARSVAHETRRPVDQVAQEMFAEEPEVIAISRAAVGVADTTTVGWAAELVRQETRSMLEIELLPMSAWAALAAQGLTLSFNGGAVVNIPQMDIGKQVGGAWVGEGGAIPLAKGNITAKKLSRYKVGGIVPITKELERTSDPAAVEVMRVFLRQVLSNLLDSSLIGNTAEVPGVKPAGLLFGIAPITGATGGGQAAVNADIQAIMAAFNAANVRGRFVLMMSEMAVVRLGMITNALGQVVFPEANQGRLGSATIIASPFIADNVVIAVSVSHFASAFDPLETDISDSATVVLADAGAAAPTHAGAGPLGGALGAAGQVPVDGGIPVSGGNGASIAGAVALSLWQTWSLGVRMVIPSSFAVTKTGAVQVVTGITW